MESCCVEMKKDTETDESVNIRERFLAALKSDQSESCEKILREMKDAQMEEAEFWECAERQLMEPIFYHAVIERAWNTLPILISNLSENQFVPFDRCLSNEQFFQAETLEQSISKRKRSDTPGDTNGTLFRKKSTFDILSYDDKLKESLVMILNNKEISLLDKFLRCITKSETRRRLISTTKNELGNFLIHIAARNNLIELLTFVLPDSNPKEINLMGETALHLAAEGGCLEAVKILMSHDENARDTVVFTKDVQENTPLHSSVKTRHPKAEIVSLLANAFGRKLNSAINRLGRSPLHVAAIHVSSTGTDCIRIIKALQALDPNAIDDNQETALHIAARMGNFGVLEAMLEVFYGLHKDVYRHNKDKDGYSLLDVCAMKADSEMVTLLIDYGANPRDGVLFHIVSESVRLPKKSRDLVKVYRTIIAQADKWSRYRSSEDKMVKTVFREIGVISSAFLLENKCDFKKHTSENIRKLLNQRDENGKRLNVIEHAVDEGAVNMLEAILHTEELYEKTPEVKQTYQFMVQHCIKGKCSRDCCNSEKKSIKTTLIERIVNHDNDKVGADMLDIEPIRSIVKGYMKFARVLYGLLTLAQIIYMTCFTVYHIPNKCRFEIGRGMAYNACSASSIGSSYYQNHFSDRFASKSSTCAYIIWPMLLLTLKLLDNIRNSLRESRWMDWLDIWPNSFPVIVIVWLCIFQQPVANYDNYVACTALVFIVGWLHVFYFISFFKRFNVFTLLLKEIILNDVLNFILLMAILLLGFSCAIVTLYQTQIPGVFSNRSLTGTAYRAFFDTLSPGSTFLQETTNTNYSSLGGKLHLLRVVVVTYEILTCVILLNILIAMMSDTYNKKIASAEHTARLSLIRRGISVISWWPFGRRVNNVYLRQELVTKIIRPQNVPKKRKNLFQKVHSSIKQSKNLILSPSKSTQFA